MATTGWDTATAAATMVTFMDLMVTTLNVSLPAKRNQLVVRKAAAAKRKQHVQTSATTLATTLTHALATTKIAAAMVTCTMVLARATKTTITTTN